MKLTVLVAFLVFSAPIFANKTLIKKLEKSHRRCKLLSRVIKQIKVSKEVQEIQTVKCALIDKQLVLLKE